MATTALAMATVWDGHKWVQVSLGDTGVGQYYYTAPSAVPVATSATAAQASMLPTINTASPFFWLLLGVGVWAFKQPITEAIGVGEAVALKGIGAIRKKVEADGKRIPAGRAAGPVIDADFTQVGGPAKADTEMKALVPYRPHGAMARKKLARQRAKRGK